MRQQIVIRKRLESRTEFWDVTLAEKRVTITYGKLGTAGAGEERAFASVAEAQFFVGGEARAHDDRGFRECMYTESYDGGQREPALEAAIAAAPEELAGYLVYADWLQQRGEPRGELIVVQHALLTTPRDRELRAREAALLADHSDRLRGPLALADDAKVDWHMGFVRGLDLDVWLSAMGRTLLAPLFAHPSLQFLHQFAGDVGNDTDLAPLAEHAPATLRWIELEGDRDQIAELRRRLSRLPARLLGVEHLQIGSRTYRSIAEWITDVRAP